MASPFCGLRAGHWCSLFLPTAVAFFFFGASVARSADAWHMLETPRFTIVSQLSEKETRAWADQFNEYIEALKQIVRANDELLPHLTVVFFARDKSFRPYLPVRPDGKPWPVAAYFNRRETWSVIGMAEGYDNEETRRTIFHEGVHWLVSSFTGYQLPLWMNEGLAEVFSTFKIEKHKAHWGEPIADHLVRLNLESPMPMGVLLNVQHDNTLFNEDNRVGIFYAQSWAFAHYLLFGKKKGEHATFHEFLGATLAGLSPNQAFKQCFGLDSDGMDLELGRYIREGSYLVGSMPLAESTKTTAPFLAAPPDFVEVALSRLALSSGHKELARKHADAAVALAPQSPSGYDMQAAVSYETKDSAGALAASQKAVELKTKDAWTLFVLAYQKWSAANALGGVPAGEARTIANLYERAINLYPNFRYAFLNLAGVLGSVEKIGESDDQFLLFGRQKFPGEGILTVGLAELARKRGKGEEARQILAEALAHAEGLKKDQVETIKQLQVQWDFADRWNAAETLSRSRKFAEALAILDELEKQELPINLRNQTHMHRRLLAPYAKTQAAEDATAAGNKEEARRLYAEVLEMPGVNAALQRHAQDALRRLSGGVGKRPAVNRSPGTVSSEIAVPTPAPVASAAEMEGGK